MRRYVFSSFSTLNKSLARSSPTYTRSFCSSRPVSEENSESSKGTKSEASLSSCTEGTVLVGLNYLKGQPPVVAKKDEEYPPWLWDLLKPKVSYRYLGFINMYKIYNN
ncbi:mitochondrial chloroplast ribosomal L54 L37 [Pyrrhoderma noxium]|uniref:Large ribosomal subunit protein mL54 n=1 Tax=Pyrrhoderma noxium TaxID=2282107 RepID=A0A286UVV3_9AGAM|nr:mitochondrial chloroplast ribosomal L54 L37 [Pyrrhoderma noxium]